MTSWVAIRRESAPDVRGISAESSERLHVRLMLTTRPPAEWVLAFQDAPSTKERMTVHQSEIYLNPPDAELESYVAEADKRIESANRFYETTVLPGIQAAQDKRRDEEADDRRRIEDAKHRAQKLEPSTHEIEAQESIQRPIAFRGLTSANGDGHDHA
jgi:hypothetical protein